MLPLGRKNAKKCSECNITCHASCAHLVPDFCGMSMERANQILASLRDIRTQKQRLTQLPKMPSAPAAPDTMYDPMAEQMGRMDIGGRQQQSPPPSGQPYHSPSSPPPGQQPSLSPTSGRMSATYGQEQYPIPAAGHESQPQHPVRLTEPSSRPI